MREPTYLDSGVTYPTLAIYFLCGAPNLRWNTSDIWDIVRQRHFAARDGYAAAVIEVATMMTSDQEFEGYARECVRLATLVDDQAIRNHLLAMAREWMTVAMHEGNLPEPKSAVGPSPTLGGGGDNAK